MAMPRIKIPDNAKVGDVIEVETLILHAMESGQCKDPDGKAIPRTIRHLDQSSGSRTQRRRREAMTDRQWAEITAWLQKTGQELIVPLNEPIIIRNKRVVPGL
jgi:Sulphur oxidation protein SoxZ